MFILPRKDLPRDPQELATALEEGLRQFVSTSSKIVTVNGDQLQALDNIEIDLSNAQVQAVQEPVRVRAGETKPALLTDNLTIRAKPLHVFGSEMYLDFRATGVHLHQAPLGDSKLVLLVNRAATGSVQVEIERAALEQAIREAAAKLAGKQGVAIENVALDLEQPAARTIAAAVTVTARKLVFRPTLHLSGSVDVSEDLVATISNLRCRGEGAIAALACAAITPQFARIEGRAFPLSGLPLAGTSLRNLTFDLSGQKIVVVADLAESAA